MKNIQQPVLRRPRSLIATAMRVAIATKGHASDLSRLTEREQIMDHARRVGDAAYSPLAHVTALARLMAARRALV